MNVIHHSMLPRRLADGCSLQTVADAALCGAPFVVEVQHLEAASTSASTTALEARVVLALYGSGKLVVEHGSQRFVAPCTLLIVAGSRHQFINDGAAALQLVTVFVPAGAAPGAIS
jgi:hypothetical protein